MTIHVVLADNQAIFRAGAARVLASEDGVRIVAQCDTPERLQQIAETVRGCVLLVARPLVQNLAALYETVHNAGSRLVLLTEREEDLAPAEYPLVDGLLCRHTKSTALVDCVRKVERTTIFFCASAGPHARAAATVAAARRGRRRIRSCLLVRAAGRPARQHRQTR